MNNPKLKTNLEKLYKLYNKKKYVHPDPLEFLYSYKNIKDREIVGLIASSLAYGNVKQILKSVSKALEPMFPYPSIFLKNASYDFLKKTYKNFKHRFADEKNFVSFLLGIKRVIKEFGSLNECFCAGMNSLLHNKKLCSFTRHAKILNAGLFNTSQALKFEHNAENEQKAKLSEGLPIIKGMSFLAKNLNAQKNKPGHLIPLPEKGSACKRMNLFLRWMVRKDAVDQGGWEGVLPSELIIPLDTHMRNISLNLGFTKRKTPDIKTALEITAAFKAINPKDPVKYDFALTRFGIRDDMSVKDLNFGV